MALRRSKVVHRQAAPQSHTSALGISPLQRRLAELEKEQRTLLKRIARKQATLDVRRSASERGEREVFGRVQPLREKALESATELVALFNQLLGSESRLNTREKQRAQSVCDDLREWLDLDELFRSFEPEAPPPEPAVPPGRNRRRSRARPQPEATRGPSATKPTGEESANLTQLFRRLALAVHPDRVRDEREKAARTERMQELTRAYEQRDLATLLRLQRTLGELKVQGKLATEPPAGEAREQRLEQLTTINRDLLRQLRELQKADKQLCAHIPGMFDDQGRFHPNTELELFLEELERDVARLEYVTRFTRRFVLGEIGLREFVKGPEPEAHLDLDEHLDDLLEAVMQEELARELDRHGSRRPPPRRRSAAKNPAARRKRRRA